MYLFLEANEIPSGYLFVSNDDQKLKQLKMNDIINFTIDKTEFKFLVTGIYTLSMMVVGLEISSIINKKMDQDEYAIFVKKKPTEVISELIKGVELKGANSEKKDFLIQFEESRWNFIKRMAYQSKASISCEIDGKVKVGNIQGKKHIKLPRDIIARYQCKKKGIRTIVYDAKNPKKPVIQKSGDDFKMRSFYRDNTDISAKYILDKELEKIELISTNMRLLPYEQIDGLFVARCEHFYGFNDICKAELVNSIGISYIEPHIPLLRGVVCTPQDDDKPYIANNNILVKLYFDEKQQKIPAVLVQSAASNNANSFRCLHKDEEVILQYLNGTLFVTGSLYNSINKHTYQPDEYALSYGKKDQAIKLSMKYSPKQKTSILLQNEFEFKIGKTSILIKDDTITLKCAKMIIETTSDINVKSAAAINYDASNITLKAKSNTQINATNLDLKANANAQLNSANLNIKTNANTQINTLMLGIKSTTVTQINTLSFDLKATANTQITTLSFNVVAQGAATIMSQISTTIQGTIVNILGSAAMNLTAASIMITGSGAVLISGGCLTTLLPVILAAELYVVMDCLFMVFYNYIKYYI